MVAQGPGPIEDDATAGALEYSGLDDFDPALLACRQRFPELDIYRAGAGYVAVPGDTPIYMATDIPGLLAKLIRAQQGE